MIATIICSQDHLAFVPLSKTVKDLTAFPTTLKLPRGKFRLRGAIIHKDGMHFWTALLSVTGMGRG